MEKKQHELCLEILRRFDKAGILKDIILIGSWSAYFYNEYFTTFFRPIQLRYTKESFSEGDFIEF